MHTHARGNRFGRLMPWTLLASAALLWTGPATAGGRPHLLDSRFKVVAHEECGYGFSDPQPPHPRGVKPARGSITDVECGVGSWGQGIYLAEWFVIPGGDIEPVIERMDASGTWSVAFAPGVNSYTPEISFAPAGWRGDDYLLYTLDPLNPSLPDSIRSISASLSGGPGVSAAALGAAAADPSGDFGGDLFLGVGSCGSLGTGILRMDAGGNVSVFASAASCEMRFGPGGAWGSDLFVAGETISPAGVVTPFPSAVPFVEFDWASGPGLDGDMFAVIPGAATDSLYRIQADGTTTLFATGDIDQIAGCGDALWVVNFQGCYEIVDKGR